MIVDALYELPIAPIIYNPGTWQSDHSVFWDRGWGAILLIEAYYGGDLNPYYHSNDDRIGKFDLPYFHNMSRLSIGATSTLVEVTTDTLLALVTPDYGYRTYLTNIQIRGANTHFEKGSGTISVWLSRDSETIMADSFAVTNNRSLNAYFGLTAEAALGLWDVSVENAIDGVLTKEDGLNILPPPALIVVSPESLIITLEKGRIETRSFTITNNGGAD